MQGPDIKNIMINVLKIFGIIGIIFVGISLAVPWAGAGYGGYGVGMNLWGMSSNYAYVQGSPFYIDYITQGVTEWTVAGILMIIAFIFTIITLLIGIKAFRNIQIKGDKTFLTSGIFALITIILAVIAISQISGTAAGFGTVIGYSYGFILMIIAMIFFFIIYGLQTYFIHAPIIAMGQQPPPTQQPPPPAQTIPPQKPQPRTGQKFCSNCGAPLVEGVKFCSACGKKV